MTVPRRSPRKRIYQDDQYQSFMNYDLINKLRDIEESLSLAGSLFMKNTDYVTFYKFEFSEKHAPEVTQFITCKAVFQRLSSSFSTVVSARH